MAKRRKMPVPTGRRERSAVAALLAGVATVHDKNILLRAQLAGRMSDGRVVVTIPARDHYMSTKSKEPSND